MTNAEITRAAELAIQTMTPEAKAAFIAAFEAGQSAVSQDIAQAYAVEGCNRVCYMATLALESSRIMNGLTDLVCDTIRA